MSAEVTTVGDVRLVLPADADPADRPDQPTAGTGADAGVGPDAGGGAGDAAVLAERRWLTTDGLYVAVTVTAAVRDADVDPLALDLAVGSTLERYVRRFGGEVEAIVDWPVAGAVHGRAAKGALTDAAGQRLRLMLVAGLTADRRVVTVQVTWPAGADLQGAAADVCESILIGDA